MGHGGQGSILHSHPRPLGLSPWPPPFSAHTPTGIECSGTGTYHEGEKCKDSKVSRKPGGNRNGLASLYSTEGKPGPPGTSPQERRLRCLPCLRPFRPLGCGLSSIAQTWRIITIVRSLVSQTKQIPRASEPALPQPRGQCPALSLP